MFAANLKYFRKRAGFTQMELANKIGVSRSTIGMYESGDREPDFVTLEAIADILNVNMSTLLGEEKSAPIVSDEGEETIDEIIQILKTKTEAQREAFLQLLRSNL